MKLAVECPRQLQHTIDKTPASYSGSNYHRELGIVSQYCWEMYFNQKVNLRGEAARTEQTILNVLAKVKTSPWYALRAIVPPFGLTMDDFDRELKEQMVGGRKVLHAAGLLDKPLRSEQKYVGRFRDIGLFAVIDFINEEGQSVGIFDGKGHQKKNADPNQVKHYALTVASTGKTVARGALLYWRFGEEGYVDVPVQPKDLKQFVEEVLETAAPTIKALKDGVQLLPTKPGNHCFFCDWKNTCEDSTTRKDPVEITAITTIDL